MWEIVNCSLTDPGYLQNNINTGFGSTVLHAWQLYFLLVARVAFQLQRSQKEQYSAQGAGVTMLPVAVLGLACCAKSARYACK